MQPGDPLHADEIERTTPPPGERTDERDKAADWIQSEVVEKGRWPLTLSEMEKEVKWSRQHLRNTLDAYFRPAGSTPLPDGDGDDMEFGKLTGDDAKLLSAYRRGYRDGFKDAQRE